MEVIRRRRYLTCGCGARGDLKNPRTVYGWTVAPASKATCAACAEKAMRPAPKLALVERIDPIGLLIPSIIPGAPPLVVDVFSS